MCRTAFAAPVEGLHPNVALSSRICWAPFDHAVELLGVAGHRALHYSLVCTFLDENLVWSSTAGDDGDMGIVSFLKVLS